MGHNTLGLSESWLILVGTGEVLRVQLLLVSVVMDWLLAEAEWSETEGKSCLLDFPLV